MMGDPDGSGHMLFTCTHCGDRYLFHLPAGLRTSVGAMKGYTQEPRGCRPREEPKK